MINNKLLQISYFYYYDLLKQKLLTFHVKNILEIEFHFTSSYLRLYGTAMSFRAVLLLCLLDKLLFYWFLKPYCGFVSTLR